MKPITVLWIVNIPIGKIEEMSNKTYKSGNWMAAALKSMSENENIKIIVAYTGQVKCIKIISNGNIDYCLLPGGYPHKYKAGVKKNHEYWKEIDIRYKPDVVHFWGTEFAHSYDAMKVFYNTPSVIYMQGVMSKIAQYYYGNLSLKEILCSVTIRDIIKKESMISQKKNMLKRAAREKEMLENIQNVIVENKWCEIQCKAINPKINIYKCELNIREEFYQRQWNIENIERYSIMSNAGGYPLKGLHVLLKALSIVKIYYSSVTLYIPGELDPSKVKFGRVINSGYRNYLKNTIKKYGLINNIVFLGKLNAEEMARRMQKSHVFVMPSCIENHSSTLIESMIVGVPCVTTFVGGIPEYLKDNVNGKIYRYEEYEILANNICEIFADDNLSRKLSENAVTSMKERRKSKELNSIMYDIYNKIIKKECLHNKIMASK